MLANIEVVSFDCYGTLIDARGGLGAFLYLLARGCGEDLPPPGSELAHSFVSLQERVINEGFRSFESVLASSLHDLAADRRWRLEQSDFESLVQSMSGWQPYPESCVVLRRIQTRRLRTGLIANCSSRIMAHTMRQLDCSFDSVLVSDDHRAYQSTPQLLEKLISRLGADPRRLLHVSASPLGDLAAARELGCRTAWLNRAWLAPPQDGPSADYEWRSLWDLLELAS